jgi:hypothetical protein
VLDEGFLANLVDFFLSVGQLLLIALVYHDSYQTMQGIPDFRKLAKICT